MRFIILIAIEEKHKNSNISFIHHIVSMMNPRSEDDAMERGELKVPPTCGEMDETPSNYLQSPTTTVSTESETMKGDNGKDPQIPYQVHN